MISKVQRDFSDLEHSLEPMLTSNISDETLRPQGAGCCNSAVQDLSCSPLNSSGEYRSLDKIPHTDFCKTSKDALVETIRDARDPERLLFLVWQNGNITITEHIERDGRLIVPPETSSSALKHLRLPNQISPYGDPKELLTELGSVISQFVDISEQGLLISSAFILSDWFPHHLPVAPYLWVSGPLGSGKTTLMRLMHCLCRRALLVGDLRGASIYKLCDSLQPTLLLDEFETDNSRASAEMRRLLRAGSAPGVSTARNGQLFTTYGHKVISSRKPPLDAALASRALFVHLLPTQKGLLPLDEDAIEKIANTFQPKLLMFYLKSHAFMSETKVSCNLIDLSPRMKSLASALVTPLQGHAEFQIRILKILEEQDQDAAMERSLEPEWLVVEALFDLFHCELHTERKICYVLVGEFASRINNKLKRRGEDLSVSAKRVGGILNIFGIRTEKLGSRGRGFRATSINNRMSHELARQFGFSRRDITYIEALDYGYGGAPCALCEEFGLTGGLKFIDLTPRPSKFRRAHPKRNLFDKPDFQTSEPISEESKIQSSC